MSRMNYCLFQVSFPGEIFYMKERKGQTFSGMGLVLDPESYL